MARGRREKGQAYTQLWDAPEVREIAQQIIPKSHTRLEGKEIRYAFCAKNPKAYGKPAWGKTQVVGGTAAALAKGLASMQVAVDGPERFYLITISRPTWNNLTLAQKEALVDQRLCACGISAKGAPCIWPPDVHEYSAVINRHGLWEYDVQQFAKQIAPHLQPALPGLEVPTTTLSSPPATYTTQSGEILSTTPTEDELEAMAVAAMPDPEPQPRPRKRGAPAGVAISGTGFEATA